MNDLAMDGYSRFKSPGRLQALGPMMVSFDPTLSRQLSDSVFVARHDRTGCLVVA